MALVAQLHEKFVAAHCKHAYFVRSFGRLFWGEQPPFTSFGRGGRYFFALIAWTTTLASHARASPAG